MLLVLLVMLVLMSVLRGVRFRGAPSAPPPVVGRLLLPLPPPLLPLLFLCGHVVELEPRSHCVFPTATAAVVVGLCLVLPLWLLLLLLLLPWLLRVRLLLLLLLPPPLLLLLLLLLLSPLKRLLLRLRWWVLLLAHRHRVAAVVVVIVAVVAITVVAAHLHCSGPSEGLVPLVPLCRNNGGAVAAGGGRLQI